ncbi:hypothetical protein LQW54_008990 [Pestalotiopsis sp. IQ-011]
MSSAPAEHQSGQSGPDNHPALAIWARLSVQLSAFSRVIAIPRDEYFAWSPETHDNIIRMFIGETGLQNACYVADTARARIFLGAVEDLNNVDIFVVDIPGRDLPVMLSRAAILGRRPQRSPPNMMRQQHDLLMQRFGAPPPYGMPPVQQGPQQYAMANGLDMNRPISTESVAHPPLAIRSAAGAHAAGAAPAPFQAPAATPPAAHGSSQPRTPEGEGDSPTRQGQLSRKRKSAAKAPKSRKRATSSVTRGRPLRREGSYDDEDDNEGQNNNQDAGNNNGSANVNLARLPSLTTTATATVGALALNHDSVYHKGKTYRSGAPRPQNAFILFRSAKHKEVKEKHPGLPNADISKVIGTMWRDLSYKERQIWLERQKQAAREHEERNPGYKFNPQQPEEKKEQQRLKKQERELKKQLKQQLKQKSTQQQRSPPAPTPARQVSGSAMTPFSNQVAEMTLQSGSSRVATPSSSARVTGVIARQQQPTPVSLQRVQPEDPFQAMTSYQSAPAQQATQTMIQNMRGSSMLSTSQTNMLQNQQQLSSYLHASPSQAQLTTEASPAASRVSADFSPSSDVSTAPTEHSASSLFETQEFGEGVHQAFGDIDLSSNNFDTDSIQVPGEMIDPTLEASSNDAPSRDAVDHESVSNLSVISEFVKIEVPNNDTGSDSGVVSLDDSSSRSHSFSSEFSFVHADMLSDNGDAATTAAPHSEADNNESAIDDLDLGEFSSTDVLRDDSDSNVAPLSNNLDETEQNLLNAFSAAGYLTNNAGLPSFPAELSPALPIGNREDMPAANASSSQQATRTVDAEFQAMMNFDNSDESFTGFVDLLGDQED